MLNVVVSRVTLLSLVLTLPEPIVRCPRILGVDEFALKRSYRYGTVLVDVESHQVFDALDDYTGDTLAAHPGAEVICRDRGSSLGDGARRAAPQAWQCADRFHLWQNVGEAVERATGRLRSEWLPPERELSATAEVLPDKSEGELTRRNRRRHVADRRARMLRPGPRLGGSGASLAWPRALPVLRVRAENGAKQSVPWGEATPGAM